MKLTVLMENTTCHCTGTAQYNYLKNQMKDQLHYLATGRVITV